MITFLWSSRLQAETAHVVDECPFCEERMATPVPFREHMESCEVLSNPPYDGWESFDELMEAANG